MITRAQLFKTNDACAKATHIFSDIVLTRTVNNLTIKWARLANDSLNNLAQIVRKRKDVLYRSSRMKDVFQDPSIVAFRRDK